MSSAAASRERLAIEMRVTARHLFERALGESSIDLAFERNVCCERGVLRVCEDLYDLHSYNRVLVVSIGKAAHTMVNALEIQAGNNFEGIVASSVQPASQARGFRYFHGGHPTPNQESIRAAEAMLKSLSAQNASSLVIFMLSGGGSSIAEKPIDDEISSDDLIATYLVLVHSGAPIAEINAIRKHLSAIKGGRLAQAALAAQQVSILVSDVPDNTPDALASGPTMPWRKLLNRMTRRSIAAAGGRCYRIQLCSKPARKKPSATDSRCRSTTAATTGTTHVRPIICWTACENSATEQSGSA